MNEFFSMGGYAIFVWPAFLVSLVVLAGLTISSVLTYREQQDALSDLEPDSDEAATSDKPKARS